MESSNDPGFPSMEIVFSLAAGIRGPFPQRLQHFIWRLKSAARVALGRFAYDLSEWDRDFGRDFCDRGEILFHRKTRELHIRCLGNETPPVAPAQGFIHDKSENTVRCGYLHARV